MVEVRGKSFAYFLRYTCVLTTVYRRGRFIISISNVTS